MTRIPRFHLVLCIVAICALVWAPLASAGPRETSQPVSRTDNGWLNIALRWVEDLVGFRGPNPSHATTTSPDPMQKTNNPTGGSCLDPHGNQYCGG